MQRRNALCTPHPPPGRKFVLLQQGRQLEFHHQSGWHHHPALCGKHRKKRGVPLRILVRESEEEGGGCGVRAPRFWFCVCRVPRQPIVSSKDPSAPFPPSQRGGPGPAPFASHPSLSSPPHPRGGTRPRPRSSAQYLGPQCSNIFFFSYAKMFPIFYNPDIFPHNRT